MSVDAPKNETNKINISTDVVNDDAIEEFSNNSSLEAQQEGTSSEIVKKNEQNNETAEVENEIEQDLTSLKDNLVIPAAPEALAFSDNEIVPSPDNAITPSIDVSTAPILESSHQKKEDAGAIVQPQSSIVPVIDIPTPLLENRRVEDLGILKEPSAPPPSIEINTDTQIQDNVISNASPYIEPTAPPPSIEVETENTIGENIGEVFRPRSQIVTQRESVLVEAAPVERSDTPLVLEPFTDEQLNHFYYNQELHQVDFFVNEFIKVSFLCTTTTTSVFVYSKCCC